MQNPTSHLAVLSLMLLTLPLACGDTVAEDSGAPTGTGDDGEAETFYEYSTSLEDVVTGDKLAGAQVCVDGRDDLDCATSAADGSVSIQVPQGPGALVINRNGYIPALFCGTAEQDVTGAIYQLASVDGFALVLSQIGVDEDTSAGHFATRAPTDGMTLTLEPSSGTTAYFSELDLPDSGLEATSTGGGIALANVSPGRYTVTVDHPTKTCTSPAAWASVGSTFEVEFRAGELSAVPTIVCE